MRNLKTWYLAVAAFFTLVLAAPGMAQAQPPVKLDILFMNHGPMQPVIKGIKDILARHAQTASATWYDFESDAGREFMRQKGIRGHIPLLIYVNGSPTWEVAGSKVSFAGFPSGYGPYQFRGKWSLELLDRLLGSLAGPVSKKGGRP